MGRPRWWLSPSRARSRRRQAAWRRLRVRRCLTTRAPRRPRPMVGPAAPAARWRARPAPTASSITELLPSLFATPLTTTAPPAASAPPTAQSAVIPFGPSSAPATARSFGQSLLVSQEQVLRSAHLGQEDDLGDSEATGSAVDEKKQAERFIKIIEKSKATAPTKAPEQRAGTGTAQKLVPILPDENLESALDVLDYGSLTALFEAGSSRPESRPRSPTRRRVSSPCSARPLSPPGLFCWRSR